MDRPANNNVNQLAGAMGALGLGTQTIGKIDANNYPTISSPAVIAAAPLPAGVVQAPDTAPGYNVLAQVNNLSSSVTMVNEPIVENERKSITLMKEQMQHFEYILQLLLHYSSFYFDSSETGTGKTYIAAALALALATEIMKQQGYLNLPMLVICPAGLRDRWTEFFAEYNLINYGVYSYDEMRGSRSKKSVDGIRQPKSGFVTRGKEDDTFVVTEKYLNMLRYPGLLLIIDEGHALDNKTAQFYAVRSMIMATLNAGTSRVGFLSATPVDKEIHCENLMRAFGILTEQKLTTAGKKQGFILKGALEVINSAYQTQPEMTLEVLRNFDADIVPPGQVTGIYSLDQARKICYQLFIDVIHGLRHSAMKMPVPLDAKNLYLFINDSDQIVIDDYGMRRVVTPFQMLREGLDELKNAARYSVTTNTVEAGKKDVHAIGHAMAKIHLSLCYDMARFAANYLITNPNHKVILYSDHIASTRTMAQLLKNFGSVEHDGQIQKHLRTPLVKAFMEDNNKIRVFSSTIRTGGQGIDLDDKIGNRQRLTLIAPTYSLKAVVQGLGRMRRMSTKSLPVGRICYPANYYDVKLVDILTALAKKGEIMAEVTADDKIKTDNLPGVIYPNQYPTEYEERPPIDGKSYPARV